MSFLREINRRNVTRVGIAYLAASWLIVQVAGTVLPLYGFGVDAVRTVITVLAIGFAPALLFAWLFEITPEGLKLERDVDRERSVTQATGRTLDRAIIVVLAIAVVFFLVDRFVLEPDRSRVAIDTAYRDGQSRALLDKYGDRSIAVLPFANMSGDEQQEFFSDGVSEELLNLLAKVPELRVISRSSAFQFKGQTIGIPEIARQLRVVHVLEGSVRQAGNKVRVTAQLIDARTDTHVWSMTYDRAMDDIFAIQDEIAAQVVGRLKVTLLHDLPRVRVTDKDAYVLYLRAKRFNDQGSKESFDSAVRLLQDAITIDPRFVDAWTALSSVYINQAYVGLRPFAEGYDLAERAIERAKEIDAADPAVLCSMADLEWERNYDLGTASALILEGLASDPSSETCLRRLAAMRSIVGQFDASIAVWNYLSSRDPLSWPSAINTSINLWWAGRLDEALVKLEEARALSNEDAPSIHTLEGVIRVFRDRAGDLDAALTSVQQEPLEGWRLQGLAMVHHARGERAESDAALQKLIDVHARGWPYNIAAVYALRGEVDRAFDWLDRAIEYGDAALQTLRVDPQLRRLHADARWGPLLTKVGQSPDQLARVDVRFDVPSI